MNLHYNLLSLSLPEQAEVADTECNTLSSPFQYDSPAAHGETERSTERSNERSTEQSIERSTKQSTEQSTERSIERSTERSIKRRSSESSNEPTRTKLRKSETEPVESQEVNERQPPTERESISERSDCEPKSVRMKKRKSKSKRAKVKRREREVTSEEETTKKEQTSDAEANIKEEKTIKEEKAIKEEKTTKEEKKIKKESIKRESSIKSDASSKKESSTKKSKRESKCEGESSEQPGERSVRSFESLGLCKELLKGLKSANIEKPNKLQSIILPELVNPGAPNEDGRPNDVFVKSLSSSGKKTALLIGALQRIDPELKKTQVLIISSTADLVHYTAELAKELAKYMKISIGLATREDEPVQSRALKEQLVISNSGTVLYFMHTFCLDLSEVRCIILDEFDVLTCNPQNCGKLFDLLNKVKRYFQVQIFSTSYGSQALDFTRKHFSKQLTIFDLMDEESCMDNLLQFYIVCSRNAQRKYRKLSRLLENTVLEKVLVYISLKSEANYVYENLKKDGFRVILLDCKSTARSRLKAIEEFNRIRDKQVIFILNYPVGHGIRLEKVRMVINYELFTPGDNELFYGYLHKVCKCDTSLPGFVVSMAEDRDIHLIQALEKLLKFRLIRLKLSGD